MKHNLMPMSTVVTAALMLTACTPAQPLDTPALREDAVRSELELIVEAVSTFDTPAIERLQCAEAGLIEPPAEDDLPPGAVLPLHVESGEIERVDMPARSGGDGGPEFHLASLRESGRALEHDRMFLPDVVVRVDTAEACLWAMAPPFVVLLGL